MFQPTRVDVFDKHVGGWSLGKIGRFYNGRHHPTVLHAIGKSRR
jgi:chromosomal replication initiation ATPase DnaA